MHSVFTCTREYIDEMLILPPTTPTRKEGSKDENIMQYSGVKTLLQAL